MPDREELFAKLDNLSDEELGKVLHRILNDPRTRATGWRAVWRRWAGSIAFVSLVALAAAGFFRVEATVDTIEDERAARAQSVGGIIDLFCTTNNAQDATLAALVDVSLNGQESFGEGVEGLTAFDEAVLGTIAKVQQSNSDADQQRVFQAVLIDLEDPTRCEQLVRRFQAGKEIPPPNAPAHPPKRRSTSSPG